MIRITDKDFKKLIDYLKKFGQDGANLKFEINGSSLNITTFDRSNKEMIIELSDTEYPFMPTVTRTETF